MNRLHTIALTGMMYASNILYGNTPPPGTSERPQVTQHEVSPIQVVIEGRRPFTLDERLFIFSGPEKTNTVSIYDLPCPPHEKTHFYDWSEYLVTPVPPVEYGLAGFRVLESAINETPEERSPPFGFCSPNLNRLLLNVVKNTTIEAVSTIAGKKASAAIRRGVSRFAKEAYQATKRAIEYLHIPGGGFSFGKDISFGAYSKGYGVRYSLPEKIAGSGVQGTTDILERIGPGTPLQEQSSQLGTRLEVNIEPCPSGDVACKDLVESIQNQFRDLRDGKKCNDDQCQRTESILGLYDSTQKSFQEAAGQLSEQSTCTERSAQDFQTLRATMIPPPRRSGSASRTQDRDYSGSGRGEKPSAGDGTGTSGDDGCRNFEWDCVNGTCKPGKETTRSSDDPDIGGICIE